MSYKILIVDDSKLARMAVIKSLKSLYPDWVRVEAGSADEAVAAVKQGAPDVALLDFNMPSRDGLDLAEELRRSTPGMIVAVVSANRQQEIVARARDIGAAFLPKPLTEAALAEFLEVAVQDLKGARS